MPHKDLKIMIVAGEASGDLHAAKLVHEIRKALNEQQVGFFGAAGPRMREAGVNAVVNSDELAIVGLPEILRALPMFIQTFQELKRAAAVHRPDAVILVDFPDFNLKLAKSLKRLGLTVVYYISPQLWAWRRHRIRSVRRYVDLMITILPFEKDWYRSNGFTDVEYVGSPLATEVHASSSKTDFCSRHALNASKRIVALLPGSRRKEITRILPEMCAAASQIGATIPDIHFIVAVANESDAKLARSLSGGESMVVVGETYDALNAADAAAVASGTATLEAAIIGTPMVIVYKTSAINYKLLRPLISVEHFGLINLIAEDRVAKELIQKELSTMALAAELLRLLEPDVNRRFRTRLKAAVDKLGHGGASRRAAEAVLNLINKRSARS